MHRLIDAPGHHDGVEASFVGEAPLDGELSGRGSATMSAVGAAVGVGVETEDEDETRDRGAILVLVLIMCVVLGVMAMGVARYVDTGLRSTRVTDSRNQRIAAADAGLRMSLEQIKAAPSRCTASMSVPAVNGATVRVSCARDGAATSDWSPYLITATVAHGGGTAIATAAIQVSAVSGSPCTAACTVTINSWAISS